MKNQLTQFAASSRVLLQRLVRLFRLWVFGNSLRQQYACALRSARKTRDKYKETEHHAFFSSRVNWLKDAARMRCLPNAKVQGHGGNVASQK